MIFKIKNNLFLFGFILSAISIMGQSTEDVPGILISDTGKSKIQIQSQSSLTKKGIANVHVEILKNDTVIISGVTNSNGAYVFNINKGTYKIYAFSPNYIRHESLFSVYSNIEDTIVIKLYNCIIK